MKFALTTKGSGLGAWLDDDFAHCRHVMIVDEGNEFSSWHNDSSTTNDENSDQLCMMIIQKAPDILITGQIDAECQQKMESENIRVIKDESGFVLDLIDKYREGYYL